MEEKITASDLRYHMASHNILFIGGAGFIGSSVIKEMLNTAKGTERIFVMEPAWANISRIENLPIIIYRGIISDIDQIETIVRTANIGKIVHLVSTMVPGCGYDEYKQELENVLFPTIRLMQLCSRLKVQFVFFSSGGTVYGERKTMIPFVETDPKEPISYYGLSKQMIENSILFENRMSDLQYLILRPSNPYGHGQNINGRQGLIAVALGRILTGKPITIWGDGNSVRDYIYVDDLAKVVVQLLRDNVTNSIVNIGSGRGYSVKEVIDVLKDVVNEEVKVEYTESRKNDVSNLILDTTLLSSLVEMDLTPLNKGIRQFYEYEKRRIGLG